MLLTITGHCSLALRRNFHKFPYDSFCSATLAGINISFNAKRRVTYKSYLFSNRIALTLRVTAQACGDSALDPRFTTLLAAAMTTTRPHFLLFCDGNTPANGDSTASNRGRWRFVLENVDTGERTEATDLESSCAPDRSALISVLRGLESLEQPSRVTLITTSRYVSRGLQYGLTEWRDNDFSWEHFGAVQPIRNADIWKRIDRTLSFHQVQCRFMAQEDPSGGVDESGMSSPHGAPSNQAVEDDPSSEDQGDGIGHETQGTAVRVSTAKTRRRTSSATTTPSARSPVQKSREQRIFVDTPVEHPAVTAAMDCFRPETAKSHTTEIKTKQKQSIKPAATLKRSSSWMGSITGTILFPFRWIRRTQVRLCSAVWEGIMALDDWLDSYLRCMLTMEPRRRTYRR